MTGASREVVQKNARSARAAWLLSLLFSTIAVLTTIWYFQVHMVAWHGSESLVPNHARALETRLEQIRLIAAVLAVLCGGWAFRGVQTRVVKWFALGYAVAALLIATTILW
jgi:hypothetical protein